MSWEILSGDCQDHLYNWPDNTFDAVVTDPPYSYNFMGNSWDNLGRGFQAWCSEWGAETLGVLKPGGYALVFGGARTYHRLVCGLEDAGFKIRDSIHWIYGSGFPKSKACLKPAYEPIVVARKKAKKSKAFPGLDKCRVPTGEDRSRPPRTPNTIYGNGAGTNTTASESRPLGRWPANLVLNRDAAAELDRQSGYSISRKQPKTERQGGKATNFAMSTSGQTHSDAGGASRFFPVFLYHAKAGRSERPCVDGIKHPTVKPLELIRWLVRLVTPPGGYVLDPFAGSGTTAEACELEGLSSAVIEQNANYIKLIQNRMSKYGKEVAA